MDTPKTPGPPKLERIKVANLDQLAGRRVYIAGKYRSSNGTSVLENVRLAERVAIACARAGVHYFCPHLNTAWMSGDGNHAGVAPNDFFLAADLDWLAVSQDILMIPGWGGSPGARGELKFARLALLGLYELGDV